MAQPADLDDRRSLLVRLLEQLAGSAVAPEDIAIIGLAGRYPMAETPDELWANLRDGRHCIREVPADRWDADTYFDPAGSDGRSYSKWAGWLSDVDCFDPLLFAISPADAQAMDPQERLFLETTWACLEDAGYAPHRINGYNPVGVFAGVMNSDFEWMDGEASARGVSVRARSGHWSIANRVSYVLDLRGPSMAVDTACSASLTAIHLACESLRRQECRLAVAGGVNLVLHPMHLRRLADHQMISHGDQCRSFGAGADGFVDGEGVGAVLLKPLHLAEQDGDRIYAVIKGSAINAGGHTGGYTVPNPTAQAEVIVAALRRARVDPRTIGYIEAHGTGTPLGDPIEIAGLREALREAVDPELTGEPTACALGSVKSNIGHLESAAGIAGLTKVLMMLRHAALVPSLHSAELNPGVDLSGTQLRVQHEVADWPRPVLRNRDGELIEVPRRAGISSFGGGGANAYLVVEEYPAQPAAPAPARPELIVLSARTSERLRIAAGRLADFLGRPGPGRPERDCLAAVAEVLGVRPEDLDLAEDLAEYGLGPAERVALGRRLGLGQPVPVGASVRSLATRCAAGTGTESGVTLRDLAYTLQVGRDEMDARLAFVANDLGQVRDLLRTVAGGGHPDGVEINDAYRTRSELGDADRQRMRHALANGDLSTAARLWTLGVGGEWPAAAGQRIGLPSYPFERKRYPVPAPLAPGRLDAEPALPAPVPPADDSLNGEPVLEYYQPVWVPEEPAERRHDARVDDPARVAVVTGGEPDALAEGILARYPGARLVRLDRDELTAVGDARRVFHLATSRHTGDTEIDLRNGVLALCQLVPRLSGALTVVTSGAYSEHPVAASLHGFTQVAAAEYPDQELACLDVDDASDPRALAAVLAEPPDHAGRPVRIRDGRRYVRRLVPTLPTPVTAVPYRHGGTYLIVGGTGGVGQDMSLHLARRWHANLVWLGRGELDDRHAARIAEIRAAGGEVLHLRADVADRHALHAAVGAARERFGAVHGVLHAAMTFDDRTIAELPARRFRELLRAKIDGTLALAGEFADADLDFLVLFSSAGSFTGTPGNAGYAAASAAQDAIGRALARTRHYPVRVVNWGYWGPVGSGARPGLQDIFNQRGITGFGVRAGLAALDTVLASDQAQLLPIRAERRALEWLGCAQPVLERVLPRPRPLGVGAARVLAGYDRLDRACAPALLDAFRRMGVFEHGGQHYGTELGDRLGVVSRYRRLFGALLNLLVAAGYLARDADGVRTLAAVDQAGPHTPDEFDRIAGDHPDITATVTLAGLFLRNYPQVLRGEMNATEVMFPDASMALVRDFYRGNPLTDGFNNLVAGAVQEYLRDRLAHLRAGEQVRVVELGAGTGATTERVLPVFAGAADRVEYAFTDVSQEFLDDAAHRFGQRYPFLAYRTLDLDRDLAVQGEPAGAADLVIATNVVHATRDLRSSLRRIRFLLRPGGWLVLNELTRLRDSTTIVGGALDGWWAFTDADRRIPDAPLATPGTWARLLYEEGFADVTVLEPEPGLGQHVLVAQVAGAAAVGSAVVAAASAGRSAPQAVHRSADRAADQAASPTAGQAAGQAGTGSGVGPGRLDEATLVELVQTALRVDEPLDLDRPLADYGFDSLTGMRIVAALRERFGVTVRLVDLLDHGTVRGVCGRLAEAGLLATAPLPGMPPAVPAPSAPAPSAPAAPAPAAPVAPPAPEPAAPVFPLSRGQLALWAIEQTAPGTRAYHLPLAFWLEPQTDIAALRASVQQVVARHPQLRSRLVSGGEAQYVVAEPAVPFVERHVAEGDVATVRDLLRAAVQEPFDQYAEPPLRVEVVTLADGRLVLLLVLHHRVFDGQSIAVFLRELSALYRGVPIAPAPTATYAEFVRSQQEMLAGERGSALREYWRNELAGDVPPARLPTDRPRPTEPRRHGASITGRLAPDLVTAAQRFAGTERASLFTVLVSAYFLLLHRHGQPDRVVVGTPTSGRPATAYADVIGYFMNMVVLHHDGRPTDSFRSVVRELRGRVLAALEHSDYPLLELAADLRRAPLFDAAFYFQNWVEEQTDQAPIARVFPGVHQEGEFDLTLEIVEEASGARWCLKYDPDLFDTETVRRFGEQYALMLGAALAEPDRPAAGLPLVTEEQRQEMHRRRLATRREHREGATLPALFAAQARRTPGAPAVLFDGQALTYAELAAAVDALAGTLRDRGIGSGQLVGVLAERSVQLLVALLAVLRAGAGYVPLDPGYPAERLAYMVEDAGLSLVLTNNEAPVPDRVPVLRLDGEAPSDAAGGRPERADAGQADTDEADLEQIGPAPADTAYVIYTSGSTGKPKGVVVAHRSLVNLLLAMAREPGLDAQDHLLALTTVCFDIAGLELFLPLIVGARVEILPTAVARDGVLLRRAIEASSATVMQATPSTWRMLLAAGWAGSAGLTAISGGEALDAGTAQELIARCGRVWNAYGPTETTIWSSACELRAGEPVTLGYPIDNTELVVLDEHGDLVPPGVPGELHIGGAGLAVGYLNRPELTAQRFVPHPYQPGERLYRTGDRVRERADGRIEYLGRLDSQVKIRGHRVELGEVESVLRRQPGVRQAVVVARPVAGENVLYGFVVLDDGAPEPDRAALSAWMPGHMLPAAVIALRELPQTPNAKVDRNVLVSTPLSQLRGRYGAPEPGQPVVAEPPAAPAPAPRPDACDAIGERVGTAVTRVLTGLVAEVLGTDAATIDPDTPLGGLGMNSVSFVSLSSQIARRLGIEVLPTLFYRLPTLDAVAEHLVAGHAAELAERLGIPAPWTTAPSSTAPVTRTSAGAQAVAAGTPAGRPEIAIIGMAGRLPGGEDLDGFWDNLRQGRDLIGEIPAQRWNWWAYGDDPRARWGGFISGVDQFDAAFFGISPREAELMDPQQRLLLEVVWAAVEDSGHRPSALAGTRTGVFIGTTNSDYASVQRSVGLNAQPHSLTGVAQSIIPNRVSYLLDLRGPSIAVDTACSSSLTALHQAVTALRDGTCDLAIVGGVNLMLRPELHAALSRSEMLSPDGRCKAFDASANGYVRGEGVGVVVLRRLAEAVCDGDPVRALVKATALNHGGRTTSLTAPNPDAQAALLIEAYRSAGIDPATVGYIEAHGTGTALGDPIEFTGLRTAFGQLRGASTMTGRTGLGSVKSNIGHLEAASGIAGVLKVLLAMRHATLPASLHFAAANPYLELAGSPFEVVDRTRPWEPVVGPDGAALPRRAGVSSFGFGGANAHVVLEEPPAQPAARAWTDGPDVLVLSARTERALREQGRKLAAFLRERNVPLRDIAHTLRVGRDAMRYRLVVTAGTQAEAADKIDDWVDGRDGGGTRHADTGARPPASLRGTALREYARTLADRNDLAGLAELWLDGAAIDWPEPPGARRVPLPTYPFERTRHWVTPAGPAAILLGPNVSTLAGYAVAVHLAGTESFLTDHVVSGQMVLPGVVYLELARQAAEHGHGAAAVYRVEDLVWAEPVTLDQGHAHDLRIAVTPEGDFEVSTPCGNAHATGRVRFGPAPAAPPAPDLAAVRDRCGQPRTGRECYDHFAALGFGYGPTFTVVEEMAIGTGEALARLRLPGTRPGYRFEPSLLDGALQTVGALTSRLDPGAGQPYLPYAVGAVEIFAEPPETCLAYAVARDTTGRTRTFDVDLLGEDGTVLARIERFVSRAAPAERLLAFERVWLPAEHPAPGAHPLPTELSIVDAGSGAAGELRERLHRADPDLRIHLVRSGDPVSTEHVIHPAAGQTLDEALRHGVYAVYATCQAHIASRGAPLHYLYLYDQDDPQAPVHAAMDGLARSLRQEKPSLRLSVLGYAGTTNPIALLQAGFSDSPDTATHRRIDGVALAAPAWHALDLPPVPPGGSPLAIGGAHLIIGGGGALGRLVAGRIASYEGTGVVLVGRAAPPPGLPEGHLYVQADVTDRDAVRRVVRQATDRFGRIAGVVQAAGTLRDGLLLRKSEADLAAVLGPKLLGTVLLDEATRAQPPEYLVAFSSTAAVFGNAGQTDYAYASSFLGHYLARCPSRALVVDWPLWRDGAMGITDQARDWVRRELGMAPLPTGLALDGLERALAHGVRHVLLATGDERRIRRALAAADTIVTAAAGRRQEPPPVPAPAAPPAKADPRVEPGGDPRAAAEDLVRRLLAAELKLPLAEFAGDEPFERYGIDSLLVMSLTRQLETYFGPLSKTLFFEYLTVGELADHLARTYPQVLAGLTSPSPAEAVQATLAGTEAARTTAARTETVAANGAGAQPDVDDEIVVVGVAGRYPQSDDVDQFWRNLRDGHDCISEVPPQRWDHSRFYDPDPSAAGRTYSRWGGWLSDVDMFDPMFFSMSKAKAVHLDPQARLFLQTVWHLMEDAGITRAALAGVRTGVFVGLMYGHYQLHGVAEALRGEDVATSSSYASVANRVSYFFGFDGPSMALDTMCSSSLTAIHLACRAIRAGDCEVAVAGGVNVASHPVKYLQLARGRFLSTDGRCRSFGAGGDGYVPAEGTGAVLLKRRRAAEADGDRILAVVRSTAVNHAGASKGYAVPNPRSQGVVIADALARANRTPADLDYLEAHGTGTALGDPVEISGLLRAFAGYDLRGVRIPLGSVKSVIGHAESAAGIAAVTKVLLQLRHGQLAPSLHAERLNANLDLEATPFVLQRELAPWRPRVDATGRPLPRTAGVSAFGAGGSNAHVILEEYVPSQPVPAAPPPYLFVLSAKDGDRLREYAARMVGFLRGDGSSVDPCALAHTLQNGREAMTHRLAVPYRDVPELVESLAGYLAGAPGSRVHAGTASRSAAPPTSADLDAMATAWVRGATVDWPVGSGRVSLPGYPFARERCWVAAADALVAAPAGGAVPAPRIAAPPSEVLPERQPGAALPEGDPGVAARGPV